MYCRSKSVHRTRVSLTARMISIRTMVERLIAFCIITKPDKTLPTVPKTIREENIAIMSPSQSFNSLKSFKMTYLFSCDIMITFDETLKIRSFIKLPRMVNHHIQIIFKFLLHLSHRNVLK